MKRFIIAVTAGVVVFGAAWGMAASLGGMDARSLSADAAAVSSCDSTGVYVSWNWDWDATDKRYEVSAVDFTNLSATCVGKGFLATLADSSGAVVAQRDGLIQTNVTYFPATETLHVEVSGVPAASVDHVALAIYT